MAADADARINNNKSCIEIYFAEPAGNGEGQINNNKSCIEIFNKRIIFVFFHRR